jgi:hypothetical protein
MIDDSFLIDLRRDLLSQAEGLAIQRAAILSQIAVIEKQLGIKGVRNDRRKEASTGVIVESTKRITENGH